MDGSDMSNWAKMEDSESLVNITSEASIISQSEGKFLAVARAWFFSAQG
jgi:hypothetical protein